MLPTHLLPEYCNDFYTACVYVLFSFSSYFAFLNFVFMLELRLLYKLQYIDNINKSGLIPEL